MKFVCLLLPLLGLSFSLTSISCSSNVEKDLTQLKNNVKTHKEHGQDSSPVHLADHEDSNNNNNSKSNNELKLIDLSSYLASLMSVKLELKPQTLLASLIYDDYYIRNLLDERYPYLKLKNGSYLGVRDYFDFDQVFWPDDKHLSRKNIEQVLYEELRAFETTASQASLDTWHYHDQEQLERSGGPAKDAAKCQATMSLLEGELELARQDPDRLFAPGPRNMQLLRWIDAWARPVSETYLGNSFWVGSFRGCRGVSLSFPNLINQTSATSRGQQEVKFNYCWAKVAPKDWPEDDVMRPKMSIRSGICLPDSCDTLEARKLIGPILKMMQFNFSPMHKRRFTRILDIYCLPNDKTPLSSSAAELSWWRVPFAGLSTSARWFLSLLASWLLLIATASVWYHWNEREELAKKQESWWRMLTIQENYRVFVADDAPPPGSRVDLRALGLAKLLAALMVVLGHSFVQSYYSFHSTHVLLLESRKYSYHLFAWLWKSVEMFYVVSGTLTAYSIISRFAPKSEMRLIIRPRVYLFLNLVRYLRVAPMFMFVWAFVKTTYLDLSEGPYWDYGTNKYTFMGRCRRISWWRCLIWPIILDYKGHTGDPYQHECMAVSWYVVTDLKMFLAVPIYVYLVYSRPRLRWPVLLGTLAFSTVWKLAHTHLQQLIHMRQVFSYGEMHAIHILISFLDSSYYSPIDRFQALALGLSAGFYLYQYKRGALRRWPWWTRGKSIGLLFLWLAYDSVRRILDEIAYRETGQIPSDTYIRLWLVAKPRLDAIIIAILTLRLCTDWAPGVMRHLLVFYKLSKLSYCVYVVHMLPVLYGVNSHERARPDTISLQLLMLALFSTVTSFAVALPMHLLIESPITLLVDYFVLGQRKALALQSSLARDGDGNSTSKRAKLQKANMAKNN